MLGHYEATHSTPTVELGQVQAGATVETKLSLIVHFDLMGFFVNSLWNFPHIDLLCQFENTKTRTHSEPSPKHSLTQHSCTCGQETPQKGLR